MPRAQTFNQRMENAMKSKMFAMLQILLLGTFLLGQTTTPPAQNAPKSDDKPACSCCAGHDMSKCKDMAECKGKDCCKDGKCTDKCPMMSKDDKGHAGMMCGDKGGKMSSDMKMDCCKDGKCTDKCPMNKDGKAMSCADCCKDNKCPMMNKDDKNKSSAEMKGCCGGDKCAAGHMHESTGN